MRRSFALAAAFTLVVAGLVEAQATAMPSFNAPYRAFARHEFGGTISFPERGDFAIEGQYRFGARTWDVGFRGGLLDPGGPADAVFVAGVEGRQRVITHSEQFPLDGAVVVGVGGHLGDNSRLWIPAGLSLGRRILIEDSEISIVPYVQPTLFLAADGAAGPLLCGDGGTDLCFGVGLGADFRLSRLFDARVSVGLGDIEGVALSAVWIR